METCFLSKYLFDQVLLWQRMIMNYHQNKIQNVSLHIIILFLLHNIYYCHLLFSKLKLTKITLSSTHLFHQLFLWYKILTLQTTIVLLEKGLSLRSQILVTKKRFLVVTNLFKQLGSSTNILQVFLSHFHWYVPLGIVLLS